ncbi:MAG TPA: proprotein convertase P-domain-containing protein [Pyrinomonadaceae bacterium]|nr:proprotein convertase P-domain-containing protein [Pyrinomonadaceae bacterium]
MRKYALFALTSLILCLSLTALPVSRARRAESQPAPKAKKVEPSAASKTNPAGNSLLSAAAAPRPAQAPTFTPVSSRAVAFAVSPAIRDLPPETPKKPDPEADLEKVVKSNPNKIVRLADPSATSNAPDSVIQSSAPQALAPATSVSFDGIESTSNIPIFGGLVLPPDTVGDVGPNHYVQMVNSNYRIFDKAGNPLTPVRSLGSIWATIGGPCEDTNNGDPIVLYDSYADRWMLSQFCVDPAPSHQLIAISTSPDPTGTYFLYDFVMPNLKFNDYPHFGVWPDGYYMSNNQFNQALTAFQGGGMYAFDRQKMLAGDPTASYIYFDSCPTNSGCAIGGMLPADADGLHAPPAGAPNTFAYFIATEFLDPSDGLRLFDFHADFAVPANSTFTERPESPVAVAPFDPRDPAGLQDIEQQGTAVRLDSIQDRLMNRLQYRRFGSAPGSRESLIVNHTVNVGTGTTFALHQSGVRYYELRRTGGVYTVAEQASFAPDATNRWMGSAAMDNAGNLAVGYSASSSTLFPSIRYAARLASDPPGGLFQGEATMHAGSGSQTSTLARWGDYSSLNVDPNDDCTFWYTQEYYNAPNSAANWRTRVGSFSFAPGQCQRPAQGTLTVNVTNCETNLPVQGASVIVDGNPYGSTQANGSTSSQLAPATYTVSITAPNYFPVTINNVSITDGNTTTINQCIVGAPSITSGGSDITAESCAPADDAMSPGETVTVDFGLKNNGTAATSNLTATLQATGGVTSPSGPQNYGSIPPDNTTVVSRPFTFTVDPNAACGSVITASLDLQDGSNSLGTVTFTFTLGALGPSVTNTTSTGNLATPIPDVSTVDIPINVADVGMVQDVNVRVRLNHTFDGDLEIRLVHPDGTTILLSDNRGGSGDNYGGGANDCSGNPTVFDDAASVAIASGAAPFISSSFRPEQALSAMNGKHSAGTWKLRITDTANLDVGTVGCVSLEIRRQRFICCGVAGTPQMEAAPPATITQESCTPPNQAVDPEETVTVELPLRNVGDGATTNLVATLQNSGGVTPVTTSQNYGVVGPLDASPTSRPFTFVAQGSCGQLITATLQLQDGATNLGTVSFTFRLGTTAVGNHSFSNPNAITILDTPRIGGVAPSSPYPSSINVAGVSGTVTRVAVRINGFNHTFPSDVDMLLVGPGGQKMIIFSDAIGTVGVTNRTYLLDDTAGTLLPSTGAPLSGTFRPANYGTGDAFPAPAPIAPYQNPATAGAATFASVYGGQNPNGVWSLYVVDDVGLDAGSIAGGWELLITTEDPVCCDSPCTLSCPEDIVVSNDAGACGAVVNYPAVGVDGSCGVVTYSHPSGSFFPVGTTTVTVTATRADSTTESCTFDVTVNDTEGPVISPITASPSSLWPPNHKMKDVTLTYSSTDNCGGAVTCVVSSVTSNEPVNGGGDGNTSPDWVIVSPTKVQLRAERSGGGTGRVYTITVRCTDARGNQTFRTTTVTVPHNQ